MPAKRLTEEQELLLVNAYKTSTISIRTLAQQFGIGRSTAQAYLQKHNASGAMGGRPKHKYTFDEHFFDVIDSEAKAYTLGFFYADGSNMVDQRIVRFTQADRTILDRINVFLNSNAPIKLNSTFVKKYNKYSHWHNLDFCSVYMNSILEAYGCKGRVKSKTIQFPSDTIVPVSLLHHFVRGYFDGDGSVYVSRHNGKRQYAVKIIGSEPFIKTLLVNIQGIANNKAYINTPKNSPDMRNLMISSFGAVISFLDWMYNGATTYLDAKYNRYIMYKQEFGIFNSGTRTVNISTASNRPLTSYINVVNGELHITKSDWKALNQNFHKTLIKNAIHDTIEKYSIGAPYKKISSHEALDSFRDLQQFDSQSLFKNETFDTKYKYVYTLNATTLGMSRAGTRLPDYFMQQSRWETDSINSPSPIRVWGDRNFRDSALNGLWSLGVDEVSPSTLRAMIGLRKYMAQQFRPAVAKCIYEFFNAETVLDFSTGWGDRLTGFLAAKCTKKYIGTDPNLAIHSAYDDIVAMANIPSKQHSILTLPAEDVVWTEPVDLVFTSPPYFHIEYYSQADTQSYKRYHTIDAWNTGFLFPSIAHAWDVLKPGGHMLINISDVYCHHRVQHICDPMNSFIATLSNAEYQGAWGYTIAQRPKFKGQKSAEPIWVWKKAAR